MAQNYNLNSTFGLNVTSGSAKSANQNKLDLNSEDINLFNLNNYTGDNVINGDVGKEIDMYYRQIMLIGMNMKAADNNIRNFDISV